MCVNYSLPSKEPKNKMPKLAKRPIYKGSMLLDPKIAHKIVKVGAKPIAIIPTLGLIKSLKKIAPNKGKQMVAPLSPMERKAHSSIRELIVPVTKTNVTKVTKMIDTLVNCNTFFSEA